jgi:hypothetical protein
MQAEATNRFEWQVIAHLRFWQGQAVILDSDLAWFLGIEPTAILEAVEEKPELFPSDFVFHLNSSEMAKLLKDSPCLTAAGIADHKRLAFTSHGVGMLLASIPDKEFSLAAIPVLRAFANYWKAEEARFLGAARKS